MPLIPFATKSASDRGYSGERLLNLFARPVEGVSEIALLGRGGAAARADLGGPVRAVIDFNGALYAVANGNLVKVVGSTVTVIGAVGTSEHVSMARNNAQIALIVGGTYYVSDGVTVTNYSTGPVSAPVWLTYADGYIVVVGEGQGRKDLITVSGLDDATTFNGLDFASAESDPDGLLAVLSDHGEVWMFGKRSIEAWYNSGDADFPFARNSGARIERGLHKASTIAKEDNAVFFVGDDLVAYRATGVAPQVISTRDIEDSLRDGEIHSAMTFEERGHKFYAIRMTNGTTLVYDITTGLWHERSSGTDGQPWFITCVARVNGTQLYGTDTGKIVTLSENAFTDDGQTILAEAISIPGYSAEHRRISRIHAQFGGGSVSLGRTPRVSLETSRDGRNWSQEKWRNLGSLGDYSRVVEWHALGAFQRFQVRVRITDPVPRDIYGVRYDTA